MRKHWKPLGAVVALALLAGSAWAATTYTKGLAQGRGLFNFAASAGVPVFGADFQPQATSHPATFLEIGACVETPSTIAVRITDGTTTKDVLLNSGVALPANVGATFVWPLDAKDQDGEELSYNVVFATGTLVRHASVREIQGR